MEMKKLKEKKTKYKETTWYKINQRKQLKTVRKGSIKWKQSSNIEDQRTGHLDDETNERKSKKKVTEDKRKTMGGQNDDNE